jgi:hypothetical protein
MTFVADKNPAELTDLVTEFKTSSMMLMRKMLDSLTPESQRAMVGLSSAGWRMCLEMAADQHGEWAITMTAVSESGERKPIADVAQGAPVPH